MAVFAAGAFITTAVFGLRRIRGRRRLPQGRWMQLGPERFRSIAEERISSTSDGWDVHTDHPGHPFIAWEMAVRYEAACREARHRYEQLRGIPTGREAGHLIGRIADLFAEAEFLARIEQTMRPVVDSDSDAVGVLSEHPHAALRPRITGPVRGRGLAGVGIPEWFTCGTVRVAPMSNAGSRAGKQQPRRGSAPGGRASRRAGWAAVTPGKPGTLLSWHESGTGPQRNHLSGSAKYRRWFEARSSGASCRHPTKPLDMTASELLDITSSKRSQGCPVCCCSTGSIPRFTISATLNRVSACRCLSFMLRCSPNRAVTRTSASSYL